MDLLPVTNLLQDLTMAEATRLAEQLSKLNDKLPTWIVPNYPTDPSQFLKYDREMRLKFMAANINDVLEEGGSIRVPNPAHNAGQPLRDLTSLKQALFDMKSRMVYTLLTMSFSENEDGFAHIGGVQNNNGVQAWNNLKNHIARKRAKDKVSRKLLFYKLHENARTSHGVSSFALRVKEESNGLDDISEDDRKAVLVVGFIDPSPDASIRRSVRSSVDDKTFDELVTLIEDQVSDYLRDNPSQRQSRPFCKICQKRGNHRTSDCSK